MARGWDGDTNDTVVEEEVSIDALGLIPEGNGANANHARDIHRAWYEAYQERQRQRNLRDRFIEVPHISDIDIANNFSRWIDVDMNDVYHDSNGVAYRYTLNRIICVCHHCGHLFSKYGVRETAKCYACGSRNATVCRAGDLSMMIRQAQRHPGVLLLDAFVVHQERLRTERQSRRS